MNIRTDFPRAVRETLNTWIPLSDGTRLAARIWLPEDAEADPVPAILEYIPYRKHDGTSRDDALTHPYLAGHGYACVRVDLRGSGDSDGLLFDEYLAQEHQDALEVIQWLADQSWCTGSVGMMGISWGGFNSLQVAALRPPALKAVITVCSTDDRYADDVHYMGGCLLNDGVSWGSGIFTIIPKPPDPMLVGDRWKDMWLRRLNNAPLSLVDWIKHQRRDEFWKHGSVCEDYDAIECAVLAVGGWVDGYSNAILRLLENLSAPCKGLIGPWTHVYPHFGFPGPAIGFLQESLRWWDRWLKNIDTGVEQEPALRCWMQEKLRAIPTSPSGGGYWSSVSSWPIEAQTTKSFKLGDGCLTTDTPPETALRWSTPQTTGIAAGEWCPSDGGGDGPEFQSDQRVDDANSLTFDTLVLTEPVAIIGAPVVRLKLAVDKPVGFLAVRLCDVAPDGVSTRITFALLNLTHRESAQAVAKMPVNTAVEIDVPLSGTAYTFAEGHRIRLAISTAYWPMVWPSPEAVELTVLTGISALTLPLADGVLLERSVSFDPPECSAPLEATVVVPGTARRTTSFDASTGASVYTSDENRGTSTLEGIGLKVGSTALERYRIIDDKPTTATTEMERVSTWERGDWRARVCTNLVLSCTTETFELKGQMSAFEGEQLIFERDWDVSIERDHL